MGEGRRSEVQILALLSRKAIQDSGGETYFQKHGDLFLELDSAPKFFLKFFCFLFCRCCFCSPAASLTFNHPVQDSCEHRVGCANSRIQDSTDISERGNDSMGQIHWT